MCIQFLSFSIALMSFPFWSISTPSTVDAQFFQYPHISPSHVNQKRSDLFQRCFETVSGLPPTSNFERVGFKVVVLRIGRGIWSVSLSRTGQINVRLGIANNGERRTKPIITSERFMGEATPRRFYVCMCFRWPRGELWTLKICIIAVWHARCIYVCTHCLSK